MSYSVPLLVLLLSVSTFAFNKKEHINHLSLACRYTLEMLFFLGVYALEDVRKIGRGECCVTSGDQCKEATQRWKQENK